MQMQRSARPSRHDIWFPCGRYFIRTVKREDASERWGRWLADPWTVHVLNTPPEILPKSAIVEYIRKFDQRTRLLLGIFEKGTRLHVGFVRLDIDYESGQALVNAVIGEPEHRNRGATTDVFVPLLDFLFGKVGLDKVTASVLQRNQVTLRYLLRLGWQLDQTTDAQVTSNSDGGLAICSVSWTKDGHRAFMQSAIGRRIRRRTS